MTAAIKGAWVVAAVVAFAIVPFFAQIVRLFPPVVTGSIITVTQDTGEQVCGVPPPAADVSYPLGTFAPGNYLSRYIVDPGSTQQVTDVPFEVTGAGIAEVLPVNSALALAGLALMIVWLVRRALPR